MTPPRLLRIQHQHILNRVMVLLLGDVSGVIQHVGAYVLRKKGRV